MTTTQQGQATVELALCLPVVALLLAVVAEIGMLAADRTRVWHSAREAARVAAVDSDEDRITEAAAASGLDDLEVTVAPGERFRVQGEAVAVTVTFRPKGHFPLVQHLIRGVVMEAEAAMRIEKP